MMEAHVREKGKTDTSRREGKAAGAMVSKYRGSQELGDNRPPAPPTPANNPSFTLLWEAGQRDCVYASSFLEPTE